MLLTDMLSEYAKYFAIEDVTCEFPLGCDILLGELKKNLGTFLF